MGDDAAAATGRMVDVRVDLAADPEFGAEAGERAARQLRSELSELEVESVRVLAGGPAPDGAKGADALTIGAVVVALSASGGVFTSLVETVRDWLGRSAARHRVSLTIDGDTIELERATAEERRALVEAYVRRHTED
ncbi:hypothetical protein HLK59_35255 [Streptomyces sp. S3(2020)]|uniref:effector-associated constant component EACC1 n=1 Tax=Streptomyces sp. S3(2020) TaxID=2732044 RepID=UPI00148A057A|nr:hypothetical protein [Streptomyces sp. S3(2020)]NNN35534.1 hypothetical protein [Streptomyces sp. S3(2020)]